MNSKRKDFFTPRNIATGAMIAAIYAALTLVLAPLSYANIQMRVSEALTILPVLTPVAIPGLTVGCLIANVIGVSMGITTVWDILFGTLATLVAAVGSRLMRKQLLGGQPVLSALCPVVANGLIVGGMLSVAFQLPFFVTMLEVAVGEAVACLVLGLLLYNVLKNLDLFK